MPKWKSPLKSIAVLILICVVVPFSVLVFDMMAPTINGWRHREPSQERVARQAEKINLRLAAAGINGRAEWQERAEAGIRCAVVLNELEDSEIAALPAILGGSEFESTGALWIIKSRITFAGMKNLSSLQTMPIHLAGCEISHEDLQRVQKSLLHRVFVHDTPFVHPLADKPVYGEVAEPDLGSGTPWWAIATLLALGAVASGAWGSWRRMQWNNAIRQVEQAGGRVVRKISIPSWLRYRFGERWIGQWGIAEAVEFDGISDPERALTCLGALTTLKSATLKRLPITDDRLAHLAGLTRLVDLDLSDTYVTDAGMKTLERLNDLKSLSLAGTLVSDSGLVRLGRLTRLEQLDVSRTRVTTRGIANLTMRYPRVHARI